MNTKLTIFDDGEQLCGWIDAHPEYSIVSISVERKTGDYFSYTRYHVFYQNNLDIKNGTSK